MELTPKYVVVVDSTAPAPYMVVKLHPNGEGEALIRFGKDGESLAREVAEALNMRDWVLTTQVGVNTWPPVTVVTDSVDGDPDNFGGEYV